MPSVPAGRDSTRSTAGAVTMPPLQHLLIDIVGFLAAASTVAAFSCSRMVSLRVAAIAANLLFILYGAALSLVPVLLLHCILLPLNVMRLYRCLREGRLTQT